MDKNIEVWRDAEEELVTRYEPEDYYDLAVRRVISVIRNRRRQSDYQKRPEVAEKRRANERLARKLLREHLAKNAQ